MSNRARSLVSVSIATAAIAVLFQCGGVSAIPGDPQSQAFYKCCKDSGMGCPEMCEYPPQDPGILQQICLATNWDTYLNCYTQGKDNTDCCARNGLSGKYEDCLTMCHGGHKGDKPSWSLMKCSDMKQVISSCNWANRTLGYTKHRSFLGDGGGGNGGRRGDRDKEFDWEKENYRKN